MVMKLVFASNNKHKLEEVRKILPADICVISLAELGFHAEIDETGSTLEENSAIKAETIWAWIRAHRLTHEVDGVFADDTGLEIQALGGAPGVRTARWAGEDCNDASNRQKALHELADVQEREAQFRTVITLITQQGTQQVEGIVRGRIAQAEEGEGGFGYDPVFIPEGYEQTFASLPAELKNSISHRARAVEAMREILSNK
jgi:XTP/dITP diphosphohydrolase